jgi:hypothetical protein
MCDVQSAQKQAPSRESLLCVDFSTGALHADRKKEEGREKVDEKRKV